MVEPAKFRKEAERPSHTCKVCGWTWQQRLDKEPMRCGKCKSPYWKVGRTYKKK